MNDFQTLKQIALISVLAVPVWGQYQRGVNLSGAEFGDLPGIEGEQYTFNSEQTFQYFAAKGLTLMRVPIMWERMQPQLRGPFDPNYLAGFKRDVAWAKKYGILVIPEIQNFGRYDIFQGGQYQEYVIDNLYDGVVPVSRDDLADFWVRMSNEFAAEPTVYAYDLMNEPHDMGSADWKGISQAVLSAIRANGDNKRIMVPGDSWSGAASWVDVHGPNAWINDPANNFEYEAHMYFDDDASGTYAAPFDIGAMNRALGAANSFAGWCRQNNVRCYVGEYGVPGDPDWLNVLDAALGVLDAAGLDGTYWSAGEFWGPYHLSVQPLNNFAQDQPQMAVLLKHLGGGPAPAPGASQMVELFYDSNKGGGETDSVASDGRANVFAQYTAPQGTWTNVVGLANGLVFFYDSATGNGATGFVDANGNYSTLQTLNGFSWWTDITWVGENRLLFYNSTSGDVATGSINPDGSFLTLQSYSALLPLCTRIAGGPGGLFLCYDASTGNGLTGSVATDGTFTKRQSYPGAFSPIWTHVVQAGTSPAGGLFFFYDENSQTGATGLISAADGSFTTLQGIDGFSGWTHVTGGSTLLFYDNLGGVSASGSVDANGNFTTLGSYNGLGTSMTHGFVCCSVQVASIYPSALGGPAAQAAAAAALKTIKPRGPGRQRH